MALTSLLFVEFMAAVIICYFCVPKKYQWVVVLLANIIFYVSNGPKYIAYILVTTALTYSGARVLEKLNLESKAELKEISDAETKTKKRQFFIKRKKRIIAAFIFVTMMIWIVIKYGSFYKIGGLSLVLPIGMSFYTFQAVGYMIDVYRGKYPAQKNFIKYFAFVSYFPHIMQGPFSRYDILGESILEEHNFSYDRLCAGAARIIWGFFKKIVIADQIGISVDKIIGNYSDYTGFNILCVVFLYAIQIYADFSGYMDIVCGFSNILGIKLQENFIQPYFSKSIEEYWRRWHLTLCQWFRDYLFYPVSMSKPVQNLGKKSRAKLGSKWGRYIPVYVALILVWTCTGLWHGANVTYLIWGYLNFIVIACSTHWSEYYEKGKSLFHIKSGNPLWEGFRMLRTFALVAFFRFFAFSDTVSKALGMIGRIFTDFNIGQNLVHPCSVFPGLSKIQILIVLLGIVALVVVDILNETKKWEDVKAKSPLVARAIIYAAMLLLTLLVVPALGAVNTGDFMYANF